MKYLIILAVVFSAKMAYSTEDNYVIYKLVSHGWGLESGDRILKCHYRYNMVNKIVTTNYSYPCPAQVKGKLKK